MDKIEQLLQEHRLPTHLLTDPLLNFDMKRLSSDISSFKTEGLLLGFMRRRIVLFMDGYRYALRAAQQRWGIDFGFYETGKDPVKKVYFSGKFHENAAQAWLQKMNEDKEFGNNLTQEFKAIIEMEKFLAASVSEAELSSATVKRHLQNHLSWWIQFFEFAFLWFCVDNIREDTNEQIKKIWQDTPESLEEFLGGVYRPMQLPVSSVEQRDILKISQLEGSELENALEFHWNKYRHLALHNIDDEPFDKGYYKSRIKNLQKDGEYEKQKDSLDRADEEIIEATSLLQNSNIPQELKNRVKFVRWFVFLRTESIDNMMLVNASFRHVFDYLAKLFELPIAAVLNMTYKEIFESLEAGKLIISKESILERLKNGYAYFIGYKNEALLTGDDMEKLIDILHPVADEAVVREIKGQVAYSGKVKAVARVILDRKDASQLKEGEILVTPMTSPDFVPAMKLSAGIITNEGGVLCHAAIMSREFQKPCVIGTKNATDIIKTGQMLTLDADNGIIILE